ncbi:MAG: NADH:ubiquinone reductase (Na(+)-transporting) subunit C [Bacteroidetes bacterium]|nr:NADH:ubiquinone reductase (Na(+)-transporting) subunit C [Bacteroidota bacterium]
MQRDSKVYSIVFATVICLVCGVLLAAVNEATKDDYKTNLRVEKKSNILAAVKYPLAGKTGAEIEKIYDEVIAATVINSKGEEVEGDAFSIALKAEKKKPVEERSLPLFVYANETGEKFYILPMRGNGLWGPIWGYISLKQDLNTIYGVVFDHETETPGLGAEITKPWFQEQFEGKSSLNGEKVDIVVLKGKGNQLNEHSVDGISGATITGNGVNSMLAEDLNAYQNYFKKLN